MKCQFKWLYLLFGVRICKKCPWNVTLQGPVNKDNKREETSHCAIAWIPILMIETRASIDKLTNAIAYFLTNNKIETKIEDTEKKPEKKPE